MTEWTTPWARAVIRAGLITLSEWTPGLVRCGPAAAALDALAEDTALFDLTRIGDAGDELIVTCVTGAAETAREAIVAWAVTVGYRRLWLTDSVVDLEPACTPLETAAVSCPTCGLRWKDHTPGFWVMVRNCGAFPSNCPACGGRMPQWQTVSETAGVV